MAIRWCRWLKVSVGWSVGVFVRVGEDGGVRFSIDQHSLIVLGWFPRERISEWTSERMNAGTDKRTNE